MFSPSADDILISLLVSVAVGALNCMRNRGMGTWREALPAFVCFIVLLLGLGVK
jgi:hypothetical protein